MANLTWIYTFLGENGYIPTLLFIITAILILYVKIIHKKVKRYYKM